MSPTPVIESLSRTVDIWQWTYILSITVALLSTFAIVLFAFHIREHKLGLRASNYIYVVASLLAVVSTIFVVVETSSLDKEKDRVARIEIANTKSSAASAENDAEIARGKAEDARKNAEVARQKAEAVHAKAEEARKNSLKAEADAEKAVLDKEKILHDNLELQKQVENEKLARLQLEQKIAPRSLTKVAQDRLIATLRPLKLTQVDLVTFVGNAEASNVASQLQYALEQVGTKVHHYSPLGGSLQGVIIEYDMNDTPATISARSLADALTSSGIQQILSPNLPPINQQLGAYTSDDGANGTAKIRVFIGSK